MTSTAATPVDLLTRVRSTVTKADRDQVYLDIQRALEPLGVDFDVTPYSPRWVVVSIAGNGINASVDLDGSDKDGSLLMIHWFGAAQKLVAVPGAWNANDINNVHFRKVTTYPRSLSDMILSLRIGFAAAADGSAFASP